MNYVGNSISRVIIIKLQVQLKVTYWTFSRHLPNTKINNILNEQIRTSWKNIKLKAFSANDKIENINFYVTVIYFDLIKNQCIL